MAIYFYYTKDPYGAFSNFSRHGIELDGKWWKTTEHYYQAQKFTDPIYQEKICSASNAMKAARLGRDRRVPKRQDWESIRDDVMRKAVLQKFTTHDELRNLLLQTGDEEIIENAINDNYWGCGPDGKGQNKLGMILQEVRSQLAKESQSVVSP